MGLRLTPVSLELFGDHQRARLLVLRPGYFSGCGWVSRRQGVATTSACCSACTGLSAYFITHMARAHLLHSDFLPGPGLSLSPLWAYLMGALISCAGSVIAVAIWCRRANVSRLVRATGRDCRKRACANCCRTQRRGGSGSQSEMSACNISAIIGRY
jgi:hypothetical protein